MQTVRKQKMPPLCIGGRAAGKRREAFLTTFSATAQYGTHGNSDSRKGQKASGTERKRHKINEIMRKIVPHFFDYVTQILIDLQALSGDAFTAPSHRARC